MKIPLVVIAIVIVGILGFFVVYSQTTIPKEAAGPEAAAPAYGAGVATESIDYGTIIVIIILCAAVLLSGLLRSALGKKKP